MGFTPMESFFFIFHLLDNFLEVIKKSNETPVKKFEFPQTSAQEIGWDTEPLVSFYFFIFSVSYDSSHNLYKNVHVGFQTLSMSLITFGFSSFPCTAATWYFQFILILLKLL